MSVAIVDYGSGNLRSAHKAFERAAAEIGYGGAIEVTADPDRVAAADRIVLPGVGAFADCLHGLQALPGMTEALDEAVRARARPFLGICVGLQLLASRGLEHGSWPGFGWIPGEVVALTPDDSGLKIPHMGWNDLVFETVHPLLRGLRPGDHAYFVHSYHLVAEEPAAIQATVDYGGPVTAIAARDNVAGTQFHPEKSQATGRRLIANFLRWAP
ncbi:imidazole glycerol phosphate synthase subunit HisH [Marinibaculum pumilum]|uniref:Imidazole glycerol phosphate synthase subunit HisH n=1 Tax=Marinibaculum pumilum TaxID=1766165 RepID=A0ABV7L5U7_9PROT